VDHAVPAAHVRVIASSGAIGPIRVARRIRSGVLAFSLWRRQRVRTTERLSVVLFSDIKLVAALGTQPEFPFLPRSCRTGFRLASAAVAFSVTDYPL
jgi:hypothetical protein